MEYALKRFRQAKNNMNIKDYDTACNRAYYAAFEAAHAALAAYGVAEPKSHRGVDSLFKKHLVKTGLISSKVGDNLTKLAVQRIIADYQQEIIDEDKAQKTIDMAEEFINTIDLSLEQIKTNNMSNIKDIKEDKAGNDYLTSETNKT